MNQSALRIDLELARHLVKTQMSDLAELPISAGPMGGTDNVIFRLGSELALRFPKNTDAVSEIEKEFRWLPVLAPHLPLGIPEPVRLGKPTDLFPYSWSVARWIEGDNAFEQPIHDLRSAAIDLGHFVKALQSISATAGPTPGDHNFGRGVHLKQRDMATRKGMESLVTLYDVKPMIRIWDQALELPQWSGVSVWIHGDIHVGNLIVENDQIKAVIDFGGLAVGDPACDLMIAWTLLDSDARDVFKSIVGVDENTWQRGRAWALSVAVIALPYYLQRNPLLVHISRHAINNVIADFKTNS